MPIKKSELYSSLWASAPITIPKGASFRDMAALKGIFMADASAGLIKDGPKNRLREDAAA
jgi:hypothetical protein